jgi:hypothetical protein
MGRPRLVVAVLITAAGLAGLTSGCVSVESGGEPPRNENTAAGAITGRDSRPAKTRRWAGAQAANYDHSYRICSVFTVREIARDMGVVAKPRVAAEAHARELYATQFRRAAFEGCMDAFQGRPPGVR